MPRSILVLPPTNDSIEVDASYVYLSTITRPLAEAGYYVFPVAVVDVYMKENGLPMPYEMSSVPLDKLRIAFGTDAVMYIHIGDWGQRMLISRLNSISTSTTASVVSIEPRPLEEGVGSPEVGQCFCPKGGSFQWPVGRAGSATMAPRLNASCGYVRHSVGARPSPSVRAPDGENDPHAVKKGDGVSEQPERGQQRNAE